MELRHEGWQYACVFRKRMREKRIEGEKILEEQQLE